MAVASKPTPKANPTTAKTAVPGKVMRAEDWTASPTRGMAAFSYSNFQVPGRPVRKVATPAKAVDSNVKEEQARQALLAERKAHAEALQKSLERGIEQGRQEGEAAMRDRYAKVESALRSEVAAVLKNLEAQKHSAFMEFETEAAGILSFALRRVFGALSGQFDEAVLPLIQHAIASLGKSASLTVKVHPSDLSLVESQRGFWQQLDAIGEDVKCVPDDRVPKGGCLVVGDATTARVDLEMLGAHLSEAVAVACAEKRRASSHE